MALSGTGAPAVEGERNGRASRHPVREFRAAKPGLHHLATASFCAAPKPTMACLTFAVRFRTPRTGLGYGGDHPPAGLSHHEGGLDVLRVEQSLDGNDSRLFP